MTKRLILHIGTHKTASTSFQRICFGFKNLLAENNICYPEIEDYPELNNHAPIAWLLEQHDKSEGQRYLEKVLSSSQCKECSTTLISSEDLENILINHNLLEKIIETAAKCDFKNIEIAVVIRDPKEYLNSIYNQLSKHGTVLDYAAITTLVDKAGYFSCSLGHFNYFFAIKSIPFINELKRKYTNIVIHHYTLEEFTEAYPGKALIRDVLSENVSNKIESFDLESLDILSSNESMTEFEVELQYTINALAIDPSEEISKDLHALIENIATRRLKKTKQGKAWAESLF